jgi:hypothetical protein
VPTPVAFPPTPTPDILAAVAGDARFAIAHLTYRGMDLRGVNMVAKIDKGTFAIDRFSGSPPEPEQVLAPDVPLAGAEPASAAPGSATLPIPATAPVSAAASAPAAVAAPAATKPVPAAAPSNTPSAAEPAPPPVPVQQVEDRADFVQGILKNLGH